MLANLQILGKVVSMWLNGQIADVFFLNDACSASSCYTIGKPRKGKNKKQMLDI